MGSSLTGYAYYQLSAQPRNFSSVNILYHAISSFSNINAPAHEKRHFARLCQLLMNFSGASPTRLIFCEFLNTPLGPQPDWTQSKTIDCFVVALIFSVSQRGPTETLGLRILAVRFYPTEEIQSGALANKYPIVSDTRTPNLKECAGSSLGSRSHRSNDP